MDDGRLKHCNTIWDSSPMEWTDERITHLKKLWSEGLTAAAISKQLRVSKNAVVGKVHRLGLKGRPSTINRKRKTKMIKKLIPTFTLADMSSRSCRWPSGDPQHADFRFCGHTVKEGKPYCAEHCDIAYVGHGRLRQR